ncbi:MAG: PQQ-dependent sugar dehydrogenase [Deltaproteobacteria bacterium]|nr:PQQ-dependent sugar dehydrogenase [Deltaproteobacteria bacterium]
MQFFVSWLAGWWVAPALLLLPPTLRSTERSPARLVLLGVALLVALLDSHAPVLPVALLAGTVGWTLGGARETRLLAVLGLTGALMGWLATDAAPLSGDAWDRRLAWALTAPAGGWCLSAGVAGRLALRGRFGVALGLVLALGVAGDFAGRSHMVAAGAATCLLGGAALAWLDERLDWPQVPYALGLALLPLAVAALRGPVAAGPYDHPPDLRVRQAGHLELLVDDGAMISSVAALPDGRVAFGEFASGRVFLLDPVTGSASLLARVDLPVVSGTRRSYELGLWGLAAHPDGSSVYAMAIERWDEEDPDELARSSRIVRIALDSGDVSTIRSGIPAGPVHAGGALLFEPGGALLASVGDGLRHGAQGETPQDAPGAGVILRLTDQGEPAEGNPVAGSPVLASGFRNVYGLALAADGALWATENGPDCCDAIHRVQAGAFHGWPPGVADERVTPVWGSGAQRLGPTGIALLSDRYGELAGDLVVATWHTGALHRLRVEGEAILEHEIITSVPLASPDAGPYAFSGAFTALSTGPDGTLWFATLNAVGRVVSLDPP